MQHSVTALDDAVSDIFIPNHNIGANPVCVPLGLPLWMRGLIAEAAQTSPDMNIPDPDDLEDEPSVAATQSMPMPTAERMVQSLAKEHKGKSRAELQGILGKDLGAKVADAIESQRPTAQQAFIKYQRQEREAKRELGRGLTAAGIQVQQHSVKDYTHVIVTLLDLLQGGAIPSVSAVVNAAFPNNPKKATRIKNSQHGKRRKQAYNSPAVLNHPMEKAMQVTHGRDGMNRRDSARTFGQSLGINLAMFKSCDRITKLEARVQLLEQQMLATKNREALADAGATSSKDKILSLYEAGIRPANIAKELGMKPDTVKKALQRARKAARGGAKGHGRGQVSPCFVADFYYYVSKSIEPRPFSGPHKEPVFAFAYSCRPSPHRGFWPSSEHTSAPRHETPSESPAWPCWGDSWPAPHSPRSVLDAAVPALFKNNVLAFNYA